MIALPLFEDDHPQDLLRWSIAGAAVVCVHAALVGGYLLWHQPDQEIGDDASKGRWRDRTTGRSECLDVLRRKGAWQAFCWDEI